ncbi:MAG TPA: hypothetical protein VJ385_09460 [Fibrobacteria bacterium]|nr:hypothetical protein [Fibrobacteria bacterium]
MEWLSDIDRADKLVVDLILYLFSIAAFVLMPAHFGRKVWLLVAWFLFLNLAFLLDFWDFLNWEGPALFIVLGQVPWILFVLDLFFKGRLSGKVAAVPMREILLWQITRLMGIHFVIAIYGGYAPEEFALQVGFSEVVTGLGALALYAAYRPEKGWYRTLLIFWNTYGLTSVLSAEVKVFLSNPHLPFSHYSREIFQYMTSYPQNWVYCFWFPITIGMHAAVFYKMYLARGAKAA